MQPLSNGVGPANRLEKLLDDPILQISLVFGFGIVVGMLTSIALPNGGLDMRDDILPGLFNWRLPWKEGLPLLPWAVLILMPLRPLSASIATVVVNVCSVFLNTLSIRRLGGNILMTIPVFVSPIGYSLFITGQTDAIIFAGFVLFSVGFDFLFFWKPQVVLHGYSARIIEKPKTYLISGFLIFGISLLIWGNWPLVIFIFARDNLIHGWWNRSLWPDSIPDGCYLVYQSIKKKDEYYGIMASPLLFPYVNFPSYIGLATVVAAKWHRIFWPLYVFFWLYFIYRL